MKAVQRKNRKATPSAKAFQNWIAGKWAPPHTGKTFENLNPADTNDRIGIFPSSDSRDVDDAVRAARKAFPGWSRTPAPRRAEILYRAGELLVERKEAYARDMTREMGKPLDETRGDVQEAIDTAFFMAGEGRRLLGQTTPSELPDKLAMSVRVPVGVCGMISPWNFPMAIPSWKLLPALVSGNTCVIKPAEDTPLSALNLVQTLVDAGLPDGVVNVVFGFGPEVGAPLAAHPGVDAISFTGSSEVGRSVGIAAAGGWKPCSLEMGGKNAMIVMDDANLELAVEGALWGAFGTTGQRCTATSRILVHKKIAKQFVGGLAERAAALRIGNGLEKDVDVGPLVNAQQLETSERYVAIALGEGARLVTGGKRLSGKTHATGYFFPPTILAGVKPKMRIAQEEVFGPVAAVLEFSSFEEAMEIANSTSYGLSSAIYTRNVNLSFRAVRELEAGIVYVNAPTIGAEVHMPFGGMKRTGNGHREGGSAALDFYTQWKTVYVDYSDRLQRAQIDNAQ
jgi:aldehyde dehydrogenase (NAD+)